jgi:tRNA(fMet)-specific endonuclease VapC
MFLLDTNICIYVMKQRPPEVLSRFEAIATQEPLGISVITLAELEHGVVTSQARANNCAILEAFLSNVDVIDWGKKAAKVYGEICTDLEQKGMIIGQMDLMIAAHCLSLDGVLVTNNVREFERVPGLKLENWVVGL